MKAVIFDVDGTLADVNHRLYHLTADWERMYKKKPKRTQAVAAENAAVHRIILEQASIAGKARND